MIQIVDENMQVLIEYDIKNIPKRSRSQTSLHESEADLDNWCVFQNPHTAISGLYWFFLLLCFNKVMPLMLYYIFNS